MYPINLSSFFLKRLWLAYDVCGAREACAEAARPRSRRGIVVNGGLLV